MGSYGTSESTGTTQSTETSQLTGFGGEQAEGTSDNPIVEVNLQATATDNFFFQNNPEEQYIGLYHRHEDGTLMTGIGELELVHDMNPDEKCGLASVWEDLPTTLRYQLTAKVLGAQQTDF